MIVLFFYVDDLLITSDNSHEIARLKCKLQLEFKMIDVGDVCNYLGAEIHK